MFVCIYLTQEGASNAKNMDTPKTFVETKKYVLNVVKKIIHMIHAKMKPNVLTAKAIIQLPLVTVPDGSMRGRLWNAR